MSNRQIRVDGDVAYVPLTKGYEAIIDAEDVPAVAGRKWSAACVSGHVYARAGVYRRGRSAVVDMREAVLGDTGGQRVYHLNGDLDYRKSSLRVGAKQQSEPADKPADGKRDIRIDGAVAYVPLSRGLEAMVDAEDVSVVAPYTWSAQEAGGKFRAVTTIDGRMVYMHRMLLKAPKGRHIRGSDNPLDCRKASLGIGVELAEFTYPRRSKSKTGKPGRKQMRAGGKPGRLKFDSANL